MTARPIRRNAQTPDRNGKIFYTSTTSLSHISKHPPIKASQIVRICQDMPYISRECSGGRYADIEPEDYPVLIDKYFATRYRGCDRNINHFFSGRIRELKFYEELY